MTGTKYQALGTCSSYVHIRTRYESKHFPGSRFCYGGNRNRDRACLFTERTRVKLSYRNATPPFVSATEGQPRLCLYPGISLLFSKSGLSNFILSIFLCPIFGPSWVKTHSIDLNSWTQWEIKLSFATSEAGGRVKGRPEREREARHPAWQVVFCIAGGVIDEKPEDGMECYRSTAECLLALTRRFSRMNLTDIV